MTTAQICILLAIAAYLLAMLGVGVWFAKKNNSVDDFYLGGRKLGPFVTAMSAEASDMSSWLLMGLPGVAYLTGLIDIHNARIAETASLSPYDYVLPNGFNEVKKNLLLPFPNAEISANYNISAADQNFGY